MTTTDTPLYSSRQTAMRAARAALGPEAINGVDFSITQPEGGFGWVETSQTAPKSPSAAVLDALEDSAGIKAESIPGGAPNRFKLNPAGQAAVRAARSKSPAKPAPQKPSRSKPEVKAEAPKPAAPLGKRAAVLAAAQRGELPTPPDFSANTHARYRGKLADLVALVEAGNLKALKAVQIPTYDSSVKALAKYRDLAVTALKARAKAHH